MQTKGFSTGIVYLSIVCFLAGDPTLGDTLCAYSKQSVVRVSVAAKGSYEEGEDEAPLRVNGELVEEGQAERCAHTTFCYALWQEDSANATAIVAQGCWSATEFDCTAGSCVSNKPPQSVHNTTTKFCCCLGHKCNVNVSDGFVPSAEATTSSTVSGYVESAAYDTRTVVVAVAGMCSLALMLVLAVCILYRLCPATRKPGPDAAHLIEPPLPPSSPTFNIDSLKIAESVGRGRYGHVFRGTLYNRSVAVKIFAAQHRHNYLNERYIYCLPFMDHPCLPKLIGADERTNGEDRLEFLLVLSYAPQGCLQEYLMHHTIDWHRFCRMAQSITQGLAHLHMEIRKDDKTKMCVVHRDLTSRNILIKADGSCMLCDFGFAICVSGSKYYINGEEQVAESTSLMDVGTLRYMAPEVLEGAVNLRDCESSLKQIDVYSLGLILWELATRCSDLFQGVEVPNYKAPFIAEIGNHPTTDQMQVLVAKNKARPLFPDIWKDTNPAVRALKETIEDCWDQDAEARLTALCVEERLIELPTLWDRHKAGTAIQGVSPTINPTSSQRSIVIGNGVTSGGGGWFRGSTFEMPVIRGDATSPTNWAFEGRHSGDFSASECTAETSIAASPADATPNWKNLCATNNNNVLPGGTKVTVPLQPYQGKNPIMERNLVMEPAEDVAVSGNSLVERGGKFGRREGSFADLFDALQNGEVSESNALVPNDVLSHSTRAVNPIPYVQNAVHVVGTIPKKPNVPGNGHSLQMADGHGTKKREGGIMGGFRNLFKFQRSGPTAAGPPVPEAPPAPALPTVNVPKLNTVKKAGASNLTKTQSMDTEVFVNDEFGMTQTVVRPVANRQVYCQTVPPEASDPDSDGKVPFQNGFVQSRTHPQLCSENNARMKRPNTLPIATNGHAPKLSQSGRNDRAVKLPHSGTTQNGHAVKLPHSRTTQNGHAVKLPPSRTTADGNGGILRTTVDGRGLPQSGATQNGHAVKLPSSRTTMVNGSGVKPARPDPKLPQSGSESSVSSLRDSPNQKCRFSLYDDRVMTLNSRFFREIEQTSCKLGSPHISASVPLSIDSLCESEVSNFHQTFQKQNSQPRIDDQQ
ncbi:bone morphogenetic protein receptor type-2-like [Uloborus diversus]|uniref:bone morphogenetic protein receptor type-2-like n=1 Tax=Uloborus diversus TaxID=327109 RepID=UPI00240A88A8|nr:bone morphogenetic protein receptor type-2-like [Uloborus diversus]